MGEVIYTKSLYTSAILELEKAADFIADYAAPVESGEPVPRAVVAFAAEVVDIIRQRAEKLREREAEGT
jgi:hypothetical protein